MLPSSTASSTPVTVAVWLVFQLAEVKVNEAGLTVPSVVSLLLSPIVTSAVGAWVRRMVKVAVPPASVVLPLIEETTKPGAARATGTRANGTPTRNAASRSMLVPRRASRSARLAGIGGRKAVFRRAVVG